MLAVPSKNIPNKLMLYWALLLYISCLHIDIELCVYISEVNLLVYRHNVVDWRMWLECRDCLTCFISKWHSDRDSFRESLPDSKFHVANMGPTWVLSAPGGTHVPPPPPPPPPPPHKPSYKNIERHTAHTIVSWPYFKQWVIVHTSDLMVILRQSIYSLNHHKGDG